MSMEAKTKVCKSCGKELPILEFYRDRTKKDGHGNECKECRREYQKAYAKQHPRSRKKAAEAHPTSPHPDILPFSEPSLNLADITDDAIFTEIRRRGYTGELRHSTIINV